MNNEEGHGGPFSFLSQRLRTLRENLSFEPVLQLLQRHVAEPYGVAVKLKPDVTVSQKVF